MGNCGVCRICLPLFPSSAFRASTDRVCTNPPSILFPRPRHPGHNSRPFSPQCDMAKRGGCLEKKEAKKGRQGLSLSLSISAFSHVRSHHQKKERIRSIYIGRAFLYIGTGNTFLYLGNDILSGPKLLQIWLGCTKGGARDSILPG